MEATREMATAHLDQTRSELDAKLVALQAQLKESSERKKSKIEKRIAEVNAEFDSRWTKLTKAGDLVKEAIAR